MIISLRNRKNLLLVLLLLAAALFVVNSAWFWRIFFPFPHKELVYCYAEEYQVNPYLVGAMIRVESKFNDRAESEAGARGIMQIMPETAQWAAEQMQLEGFHPDRLYEPEYNIRIGVWYLANLLSEFDGDVVLAVAAYNAGRGNVRHWLESKLWDGDLRTVDQIPYRETRNYVKDVMFTCRIYEKAYR